MTRWYRVLYSRIDENGQPAGTVWTHSHETTIDDAFAEAERFALGGGNGGGPIAAWVAEDESARFWRTPTTERRGNP